MAVQINKEIEHFKSWFPSFPRWKNQLNGLNTADAEIFKMGKLFGSMSVDTLHEEILWGLYQKPETIGWIAAIQSLTDVTATGIKPQTVVLSSTWKSSNSSQFKKQILQSYLKALKLYQVHLLGGDSASGQDISLTTTAFGWSSEQALTRLGLKPGDLILSLGNCGTGPALGLRCVLGLPDKSFPEKQFRPRPPIQEFLKLKKYFHCAIDVSDGLASSLCILSELNQVSFDIAWSKKFFNKASVQFCQKQKLPLSSLFFAEHGDYHFLVGISPKNFKKVKSLFPQAQVLACATPKRSPCRMLNQNNQWQMIPLDFVFNSPKSSPAEVRKVLNNWTKLAKKWQLG